MPHYMVQVAYTSDAIAKLVKNPVDRTEAIRPVIEGLGGRVENGWFTFGEYDVMAICELPDNVTAAAFSFAASAAGAVKSIKTTPLLAMEDAIRALTRAQSAGYQPPR